MFKDLRTSTKLVILCTMFLIVVGATTYSLVAEKQIAIRFARKELVGTEYLTAVRDVYAAVLAGQPINRSTPPSSRSTDNALNALATTQKKANAMLQTSELAQTLASALRRWSGDLDRDGSPATTLDVLAAARQLVSRVGDDSNLALDPDLDSYHLQDLVTKKLPAFLGHLADIQVLSHQATAVGIALRGQKGQFQIMQGLLQSITQEIRDSLAAAYRGNPDGSLKQAIDGPFTTLLSSTGDYLEALSASFDGDAAGRNAAAANRLYGDVAERATGVWAVAQSQLERLLQKRIDGLVANMLLSLALTGALAALCIVIAVLTHRHIVRPLERLESIASTVRKTKDYSLRIDYSSKNEMGQLAAAFNDMLSELATARDRERAEHSELARVARLTTMGAMTASIAHEINQPLAAIVANSNAAQRWLTNAKPDLDEARSALQSIGRDAHRASNVIGSVRAMFRKDSGEKDRLAVNDVIEEILTLVHGEIHKHGVSVGTDLLQGLPHVVADRTQLQQVFMNLIMNAVEAMKPVTYRERLLTVRSNVHNPGNVIITVEDSGIGIDTNNMERMFDAFFTTKADGMGMGLSICRLIIEAHGGLLWATPGKSHGSVFHLVLPSGEQ